MAVLHSKGYVWWVERGKLALGTTSNYGSTVQSPTTASEEVRVYGKLKATAFATGTSMDLTEESTLPSQFHEALVAKAMVRLYQLNPNTVHLAQYWQQVYNSHLIAAKKYANTNRFDSGFTIKQHEM